MSEKYNTEVSKHYAAYRPPIHSQILRDALSHSGTLSFSYGLDIGCGTGISSEALGEFCTKVIGIDPSRDMLDKAESRANLSFVQGTAENIPFPDHSADIVTFAGSLSYAKTNAVVAELIRVCRSNAYILAYDFKVQLSEFTDNLGAKPQATVSNYNHAENFSGYNELLELKVHQGQLTLEMTSEQLAHVLFSSAKYYLALAECFGQKETFSSVVQALEGNRTHQVRVDTYYSTYQIKVT